MLGEFRNLYDALDTIARDSFGDKVANTTLRDKSYLSPGRCSLTISFVDGSERVIDFDSLEDFEGKI